MKRNLVIFILTLVAGLGFANFRASANFEVSAGVSIQATADFYDPLAAQGTWVTVGSYGRCWRPRVAVGWRPYCEGEWVWTDAGWYWQSSEPWAWACYHYGCWAEDPAAGGWIWVPGTEWAPAWVSWRVGGGHVGWAPLPPAGVVVAPAMFVFVEDRHFNDHVRPSTVIVNNTTIIRNTTVINAQRRENRNFGGRSQQVIVNEGPQVTTIEKATGRGIKQVAIQDAGRRTPVPANVKRHRTDNSGGQTPASMTSPESKPFVTPQPTTPSPTPAPAQTPPPHFQNPAPAQKQMPEHRTRPPVENSPPPAQNSPPPAEKSQPPERITPAPRRQPEQNSPPPQRPEAPPKQSPSAPGSSRVVPPEHRAIPHEKQPASPPPAARPKEPQEPERKQRPEGPDEGNHSGAGLKPADVATLFPA